TARFLAIHREGTQDLAVWRENWGRPAGAQPADFRERSVVGPERIGQHIFYHDLLAQIHGCSAGAISWSDRRAIDRFHISLRQTWRCAVPHVLPVPIKEQEGTAQSIGLPFHKQDKARQDLGKRSVGCNHFQNAALIEKEKLFLLNLR